MDLIMTTRRAATLGAGVAALVLLFLLITAASATAAPRFGITVARGVPAEASATPVGATSAGQQVTAASIAAPLTQRTTYQPFSLAVVWAAAIAGAMLLLAGAGTYGLSQRRRTAEVTELARASREDEEQRRRAA